MVPHQKATKPGAELRRRVELPADSVDYLVVGLGNPGSRFEGTLHNAGARVVELLATRFGVKLKVDARVRSRTAAVRMDGARVLLAVPSVYMNESGSAVAPLLARHRVGDMARVVVVHDELDLEPGVVRVKRGGGLAGHHGLESVAAAVGRDFTRVRIGVGKPSHPSKGAEHVLSRPSGERRREFETALETAADAVEVIVTQGLDKAMTLFNARRPSRS
ncbi:MAG: peptidyl-tRNA hydrolase [Acidimicrobiales bacterium]|nr:MAG: peptidyl-tRNA hydrolase [Acidimicrobiales bacterium]